MFLEFAQTYEKRFTPFAPPAPAADRSAWEALPQETADRLSREGAAALREGWSQILATDFLEFSRTGNREQFETKQFSRRTRLNSLILAECAEHQGRYLDEIVNGLWLICGEPAWQLPAHNAYLRDTPQLPFPDVRRPVLDLFAAETGAVLAAARYVMKEELDQISPLISTLIQERLQERILTPYLTEHFWWMGDGTSPMNNWTVWCTQNVLLAAALSGLPQETLRAVFEKACRSIDYFLDEYGEDGCCDEGAQYYRHAGLCLFGCMEILNGMTGGHFSALYQEPKIRNIAAYIRQVHVSGPYYINFSDCSPVAGRCSAREFLFGKRTGDSLLMRLAAQDNRDSADPLLAAEHNLYYRLQAVFAQREMAAFPTDAPLPQEDLYYPSAGLFLARDQRFCLAVKAGDNDDSHNHNDTGSFTIYKDGRPLFADIGVETYQKKTFSPQRYEIWTMQSQYHNLPSFLGCEAEKAAECPYGYELSFGDPRSREILAASSPSLCAAIQHNGPEYRASQVEYAFQPDQARIQMDIAGAYPDPRVRSYQRTVILEKGKGITIWDRADCAPLKPVLSLITYETPRWQEEDSALLIGDLAQCRIQGASAVLIQRLPITDNRLKAAWEHDMWRTLVVLKGNEGKLEIR